MDRSLGKLGSLRNLVKINILNFSKFPNFSKFITAYPMPDLITRQGDHRALICYRKAELIYDLTHLFVRQAFTRGDRTIDQMVQAARSGKQNIVEGNADLETSQEMGIKLINVAKASFRELLADYEDFLRVNELIRWSEESEQYQAMRRLGRDGSNERILQIAASRSLDVVANMVIVLLKQEDYLLHQLLQSLSNRFLQEGGFKERMFRMRVQQRSKE